MKYNRQQLAQFILDALDKNEAYIRRTFLESAPQIGYFFIDDVLPEDVVMAIFHHFPKGNEMVLKKSLRENKYVAAQMNKYHPLLEEIIYAFQDERVVEKIRVFCDLEDVFPDPHLYAGGLSRMETGQFLQPHLDNSHDKDRARWRILNLLYYVTPDWTLDKGGHLELWPNGLSYDPIVIESKFNRLAVMATHQASLHSVRPVTGEGARCCVSNYYFSNSPLRETDTFHVTTFRGRPGQKWTDLLLRIDASLRMGIRKIFKKGVVENPHVYKKNDAN